LLSDFLHLRQTIEPNWRAFEFNSTGASKYENVYEDGGWRGTTAELKIGDEASSLE